MFDLLAPNSLEKTYRFLIQGLNIRNTRHIAIDGKASRGCYKIKGHGLLHVVSAYDTEKDVSSSSYLLSHAILSSLWRGIGDEVSQGKIDLLNAAVHFTIDDNVFQTGHLRNMKNDFFRLLAPVRTE